MQDPPESTDARDPARHMDAPVVPGQPGAPTDVLPTPAQEEAREEEPSEASEEHEVEPGPAEGEPAPEPEPDMQPEPEPDMQPEAEPDMEPRAEPAMEPDAGAGEEPSSGLMDAASQGAEEAEPVTAEAEEQRAEEAEDEAAEPAPELEAEAPSVAEPEAPPDEREPQPEPPPAEEPEPEPEIPPAAVVAVSTSPFDAPGEWYVVHTYAGYENKVKANLQSRITSMQMEDKIFDVVIPMEDVMEIKGGKRQVVQKKVFPGYLLVKMFYDNDSWYVVRNTPGVTGFVASGTGQKPTPLSQREVEKILAVKEEEKAKPTFRLEFEEGDVVRIISGPFADFNGTINEINVDQSKLKVLVNIFDRETPVELGFDQVARV
jgi:transcriptional antiterminator NusG